MIPDEKLDFWIKTQKNVLLIGKKGCGKCLGFNTPVMKFNGRVVKVQDIKVGDKLMGWDSTPRTVTSLARGVEEMFKIVPVKGNPFECNGSHILTLQMCCDYEGYYKEEIIDMSVNDYMLKTITFRQRAMLFRTGVNFYRYDDIPVPPYLLGLWLGDGSSSCTSITNIDTEIISYIKDYADNNNLKMSNNPKTITYNICSKEDAGGKKGRNSFRNFLIKNNLINRKHIPKAYLKSSRDNRLELLAGIIDSDGYLHNNCYEVTQKSTWLADDIVYLARSLGLAAYSKKCEKGCMYKDEMRTGIYNRIMISGDTNNIPCKLARKIATKRQQIKNVLRTGIKSIESLGVGDYYGFTIGGDGRFLLGDFTVTHNTTCASEAMERNNIKYKYFSAPTLDPWVDFVGIPKEKIVGNERVIEFIKPDWHNDDIECIILDEYNRSNLKIKAACMELIQFKTINGAKFKNLKMVWAMINEADDEDYDVEKMDPAQKDRFHIHYTVPYMPDRTYFEDKFGDNGSKCIVWWKDLASIVKNEVSPRRLDYAMEYYEQGGELEDILPANSNIEKLTKMLSMRNIEDTLNDLRLAETDEIRDWFNNQVNIDLSITTIINNEVFLNEFLYYLPKEEISKLISTNNKIQKKMVDKYDEDDLATEILDEIIKNDANKTLCKSLTAQVSAKRLQKAPLKFGTKETVQFNSFNRADVALLDSVVKSVKTPPTYYSAKIKSQHINELSSYAANNIDSMKTALTWINKIALSSADTIFNNNQQWIALLNSFLLKQQDEHSIGSQKLIKKEFGCLFTKVVRLKLEGKILECRCEGTYTVHYKPTVLDIKNTSPLIIFDPNDIPF